MNAARHLGAWLIVACLVVALVKIWPDWPVMVVGFVGAGLFVISEIAELLDNRP